MSTAYVVHKVVKKSIWLKSSTYKKLSQFTRCLKCLTQESYVSKHTWRHKVDNGTANWSYMASTVRAYNEVWGSGFQGQRPWSGGSSLTLKAFYWLLNSVGLQVSQVWTFQLSVICHCKLEIKKSNLHAKVTLPAISEDCLKDITQVN